MNIELPVAPAITAPKTRKIPIRAPNSNAVLAPLKWLCTALSLRR